MDRIGRRGSTSAVPALVFLGCGVLGLALYGAGPGVLAAPLFMVMAVASIGAALHPFLAKSQLVHSPVLVVEGWNAKTGLGSRFGSELLKRGFKGKYNNIGTHLEGSGGLWQQMGYQGLDSEGIQKAIKALA